MLEIKVDILKNRLYLTLGRVRKDKVADSSKRIEEEIHRLDHGFSCITRILDVRDIDENDIHEIIKIQDLLSEKGMSRAVRVGIEAGKELLDRIGDDAGYIALTADNLEEAEKILDELDERDALKK
ncbi:MAG: hypothetical protein JRF40_07565 [Deltaproteobacteria bacterium]|nr:hypothetical protein [Deltaproteobacteria bacterium]MBW2219332.1 hypothetical protein [Deltaproteobacteria bacterium]